MFLQIEISAFKESDDNCPTDPGMQPNISKQNLPSTPDTHSVISIPVVGTPREEGRLATAMTVPQEAGRPISSKKLMGSRDSLSQLPPQPIMPDGLQPVTASSRKLHTPKSTKSKVAPVPQSAPLVVSQKSEISELE